MNNFYKERYHTALLMTKDITLTAHNANDKLRAEWNTRRHTMEQAAFARAARVFRNLRERELKIVELTAEKKTDREIAEVLGCSIGLVSVTRSQIYKSLKIPGGPRGKMPWLIEAFRLFKQRGTDSPQLAQPAEPASALSQIEEPQAIVIPAPSEPLPGIMETFFPPEPGKLGTEIEILCSAQRDFKEKFRALRRAGYIMRAGTQFHSITEPAQKSVTYLYLFR